MWKSLPILAAGGFALGGIWEMSRFEVTDFSAGGNGGTQMRCAVLSDIHDKEYGRGNIHLISAVSRISPDVILMPGDLVTVDRSTCLLPEENLYKARALVRALSGIAPVIFSPGNHERRLKVKNPEVYGRFKSMMESEGMTILENRTVVMEIRGKQVAFTGVDLPLSCYRRFGNGRDVTLDDLKSILPDPVEGAANVLLAHHPDFFPEYAKWGADVVFSGHKHGCLVRVPGIGSVVGPDFTLFPDYDAGEFRYGKSTMYVSRGLGTHTINVRVFDRAQVVNALIRI
ncbi:MAG: metallophosphoesterase [Eubacterium sp.]|nr:metallophosphoesterase [Eubacterium sp.]